MTKDDPKIKIGLILLLLKTYFIDSDKEESSLFSKNF